MSGPIRGARRAVPLAAATALTFAEPAAETGLSAIVHAQPGHSDLAALVVASAERLMEALHRHGAVLLRGFDVTTPEALGAVVTALGSAAATYRYGSTPRTDLGSGVYTSTEYPADQAIPFHNEQAYARDYPRLLWFACAVASADRGATPLADSRRVLARLRPETRAAFAGGVRYVRNFGQLDVPWQQAFGTEDPAEVDAFCADAGITAHWRPDGRLRTTQVLPAEVRHPVTGEACWFNQAHLFHVSALPPDVAEGLLSVCAEEDLPRHALLGDGSAIPAEALTDIRAAYAAEATRFDWQAGDVLLVDNLLAAHGREPFSGPRRILVAMNA